MFGHDFDNLSRGTVSFYKPLDVILIDMRD
jgi:hypothetical protein